MCEKASRAAAVAGTITAISFTGRQTISPRLHELCVAYQLCFVLIDADLMFSEGSLVLGLLLLNRSNFLAVEPQVSTHTTGHGTDCCGPKVLWADPVCSVVGVVNEDSKYYY
jgi:hypothetical protein